MATAALIDHTNFDTLLVQSTQGRSGTPDGNIFFDVANDRIEFITASELATVDLGSGAEANPLTDQLGITMRGIYNFENQERRVDETLRKYKKGVKGDYRFAGAFSFINGVKPAGSDREKIRGSGFIEYAEAGDGQTTIDRIYHGNKSLVDIQATSQPYYALVTATDEATLQSATWNDYARLGDIDEAVQVFGTTANGDAGAGSFDYTTRNLVVRVRSWQYNPGETTAVLTGIAEFSGFSAGYGVGESLNPNNTYTLADVYGGSQIAPWTGMTLEKLVTAQTETGFNEADGDFTWVLNNTAGATVEECAAYLDALTLQDADIDAGAGTYNGKKGRVWYTRNASGKVVTTSVGGDGLFIENLPTAEQQKIIFTDDAGATKTYPFFPEVQIEVGANAVADTNAHYSLYYVDGASTADFDSSGAVLVQDKDGNDIQGNVATDVTGTKIIFPYAYDTDTDAGLSAGVDKDVVIEVEGDGGVAQAITYFTITRDTTVSASCIPPIETNA